MIRIENLSRRQRCICFTLPYILIKASAFDEKKPQNGAFYEGNSLDRIKAYLLQSLGCLQDLIHVARYLNATPFFGQFAADIE